MTRVLEMPVTVPPLADTRAGQVDLLPAASRPAAAGRFADALHLQLLLQDPQLLHNPALPDESVAPAESDDSMLSPVAAQAGDISPVMTLPVPTEAARPEIHNITAIPASHLPAPTGSPAAPAVADGADMPAFRVEAGSFRMVAQPRLAVTERAAASMAAAAAAPTESMHASAASMAESAVRHRDGAAASPHLVLAWQGRAVGQHFTTVDMANVLPTAATGSSQAVLLPERQVDGAMDQKLVRALGDRLQLHITQRTEQAVIRLDPPRMGTIEIDIRHEAGSVQVYLRATHAEVARQLHAIGDALRQDLAQRQSGEVSVFVYDASREGEGRHRQRQTAPWSDEPGRALAEANDGEQGGYFTLLPDGE